DMAKVHVALDAVIERRARRLEDRPQVLKDTPGLRPYVAELELPGEGIDASSPAPGPWDASATRTARAGALATSVCRMTWAGPTRRDPPRPCRHPAPATQQ